MEKSLPSSGRLALPSDARPANGDDVGEELRRGGDIDRRLRSWQRAALSEWIGDEPGGSGGERGEAQRESDEEGGFRFHGRWRVRMSVSKASPAAGCRQQLLHGGDARLSGGRYRRGKLFCLISVLTSARQSKFDSANY